MITGFGVFLIVFAAILVAFAISYILVMINPFKMPIVIKTKIERVFSIITRVLIIGLLSLFFVLPLWIVLCASLSDSVSFIKEGYSIFIKEFSLEGYVYVFKDPRILKGLGLSALVTILVTVLSVLVNTFAAYALSEKEMPGHKFFNGLFVFTMLFSTGMVPIVLVIRTIGLYNQFWALVFPAVINVYNILLIRNYIYSIPKSLKEAAIIDGAGQIRIFFKIILPQALKVFAPTYIGEVVGLIKATAVVGYIAVNDLTKVGDIIRSNTYEAFFPLIAVAPIYFMITWIVGEALGVLGRKFDAKQRKEKDILKGVTR